MDKNKLLTSVKKAQSTLNKVSEMIDADAYCIDIIHQTLTIMWLLKWINMTLIENQLKEYSKWNDKATMLINDLMKIMHTASNKCQ
jgi:DNA-binding FrmR family transcriptional regulator